METNTKERPLYFYVANLGSEAQRVFAWKEKGDKESMRNAYDRAVSIIDTIKKFGNENANAEMDILQKCLEELIKQEKECALDRAQISSYFSPFALRITNSLLN